MTLEERRRRYERLPPRTRELVFVLVTRPELSVVDAARLVGLSVNNGRTRLHRQVYSANGFGVESRTHLVSELRDVIGQEPVHVPDALAK